MNSKLRWRAAVLRKVQQPESAYEREAAYTGDTAVLGPGSVVSVG